MMRSFVLLSVTVAGVGMAQVALERAPVYKATSALGCPAGTRQVGAPTGGISAMACMRFAADGVRTFHGPMVSFYDSGKVEAVGQMEEGRRTGKWTFFNTAGVKVGETEFLRGDYHGRRVEFLSNGQVKFDEHWVNGKRQGPQKSVDASGVLTLTEYRDDRPVTK